MWLLLLLSALLSSLGGVVSAVRGQTPPAAIAQAVVRCVERCAARVRGLRPIPGLPTLAKLAGGPVAMRRPPWATHPLYASRRRE